MIVWGRPNSVNVKKVLWTAGELNLEVDNRKVGGQYGGLDTPEFLALNPNGRIPVLQDKDIVLWESDAIVRYLTKLYNGETRPALWIKDDVTNAIADQWMTWASANLLSLFNIIMAQAVRLPQEQRDPKLLADTVASFGNFMKIANAALEKNEWIAGDHMSVGDINLGTFIYYWFEIPLDKPEFSALHAYYERLKERPAYREHIMIPIT